MRRLGRRLLVSALVACLASAASSLSVTSVEGASLRQRARLADALAVATSTSSSANAASPTLSSMWPLSSLLEHRGPASGSSGSESKKKEDDIPPPPLSWEPTPRTRLEKLALASLPRVPEPLAGTPGTLFDAGSLQVGDRATALSQEMERAREPQAAAHFNGLAPIRDVDGAEAYDSALGAPPTQASRLPQDTSASTSSSPPTPVLRPRSLPPPGVKAPTPAAKPVAKKAPPPEATHRPYPSPPAPENPLPTPPLPSCEGICDPDASNPLLARVPAPPLTDAAIAAVGLEGEVLAKVMQKLKNREGWLRAQKNWLSKATEAAAAIRREIAQAEFTRNAVTSDLQQLQLAQDALSIKYKADRLKWSYKDKKMTLEALKERFDALKEARADVSHQIREAKDEVTILENTLGPPSQQVQISPKELEDPLEFLEDVIREAQED